MGTRIALCIMAKAPAVFEALAPDFTLLPQRGEPSGPAGAAERR